MRSRHVGALVPLPCSLLRPSFRPLQRPLRVRPVGTERCQHICAGGARSHRRRRTAWPPCSHATRALGSVSGLDTITVLVLWHLPRTFTSMQRNRKSRRARALGAWRSPLHPHARKCLAAAACLQSPHRPSRPPPLARHLRRPRSLPPRTTVPRATIAGGRCPSSPPSTRQQVLSRGSRMDTP